MLHKQGTIRGFLVLRSMEGKTLASGDLIQVVRGDRLISSLIFHFKDGSIDDETTVFSQHREFRLLSDHHVQKGPSFPHPMDVLIDASSGQVTVRSSDGGNEKSKNTTLTCRLTWETVYFSLSCRTSRQTRRRRRYPTLAIFALRTVEGTRIATGDVTQVVHGDRVTSRLIFRFRDGSIDDDTTVFSQRGTFRLISDHHVQRGPSFPRPMDILINALTGEITSRSKKGGVRRDHIDLPVDVSNGLPPNLLMNLLPSDPPTLKPNSPLSPPPRRAAGRRSTMRRRRSRGDEAERHLFVKGA